MAGVDSVHYGIMPGKQAKHGRGRLRGFRKRIGSLLIALVIASVGGLVAPAGPSITWQPVRAAEEAQSNGSISEFRATPARLRGRVELSWKYAGKPFAGSFVVERSTNGGAWRAVSACVQPFNEGSASYGCADSGLTSGTRYAYRACITARGATCTKGSATKSVAVKAP